MEKNKDARLPKEHFMTGKGRAFQSEEIFMKKLSAQERKTYEECMALLQEISENEGLEEACELLEKYTGSNKEP